MRNFWRGMRLAWATRSGPCLHPFYCVLLSHERKNRQVRAG